MSVEQLPKTEQRCAPLPLLARLDGELARLAVPGTPEGLGYVRDFVRLISRVWQAQAVADNAEMCVYELAANAHQHATPEETSPFVLIMRRVGARLRYEIHDHSRSLPYRRNADLFAEDGRGLMLVEAMADAHGAHPTPHGKAVWCEFIAWPADEQP